jgi:putative transposase
VVKLRGALRPENGRHARTPSDLRGPVHCRSTRAAAYARLLREALADDDLAAIRTHLQQQRAPGHPLFQAMVEARTRRFVGVRPAHRPTRAASNSGK